MIVVDVGCTDYGHQDSVSSLIAEYHPGTLYGFDPSPHQPEVAYRQGRTKVVLHRLAAWLFDGEVAYHDAGTSSKVGEGGMLVPCIDLATWLRPKLRHGVVLKLDMEGGEYQLIPHLGDDVLSQLQELVVEWHQDHTLPVPCPTRAWWF